MGAWAFLGASRLWTSAMKAGCVMAVWFGWEVWISLGFRSLCFRNNDMSAGVIFPKELGLCFHQPLSRTRVLGQLLEGTGTSSW